MELTLISLNIQQDLHHHLAIPFLQSKKPDIVCLQEVFKEDLHLYEEALGMKSFYKPECFIESLVTGDGKDKLFGVAILTNKEAVFDFSYIVGDEAHIPVFDFKNSLTERNIINTVLIWVDIQNSNGKSMRVATTHFTWTPDGSSTKYQLEDMQKLINVLDTKLGHFILTGDLNAPRGSESFSKLAEKYIDNIPEKYDSSLDPNLHRVRGLKHMVDGLFSTKEYTISNVSLEEGASDHKAVIATISL